jgi:hypothetical protein
MIICGKERFKTKKNSLLTEGYVIDPGGNQEEADIERHR